MGDTTSEKLDKGMVYGRFIIEILGAPREHIETVLRKFVDHLKADKGLEIVKAEFAEAEPQGKLFSTFVELEIWLKSWSKLIEFCFDAMPSSVEIIEPNRFVMDSGTLSGLLNDLQAKMHAIDMKLKETTAENKMLNMNAKRLLKNFMAYAAGEGKTPEEVAKKVGINEIGYIIKLLDELIKEGLVAKGNDGLYRLIK